MKFKIGEIISGATGRLLCDIGKVYEILNYMTGDNLFTHQLPRACRECRPYFYKQFPWLNELNTDEVNTENWKEWLDDKISKYGEEFEVIPINNGEYKSIDPIKELINNNCSIQRKDN